MLPQYAVGKSKTLQNLRDNALSAQEHRGSRISSGSCLHPYSALGAGHWFSTPNSPDGPDG